MYLSEVYILYNFVAINYWKTIAHPCKHSPPTIRRGCFARARKIWRRWIVCNLARTSDLGLACATAIIRTELVRPGPPRGPSPRSVQRPETARPGAPAAPPSSGLPILRRKAPTFRPFTPATLSTPPPPPGQSHRCNGGLWRGGPTKGGGPLPRPRGTTFLCGGTAPPATRRAMATEAGRQQAG